MKIGIISNADTVKQLGKDLARTKDMKVSILGPKPVQISKKYDAVLIDPICASNKAMQEAVALDRQGNKVIWSTDTKIVFDKLGLNDNLPPEAEAEPTPATMIVQTLIENVLDHGGVFWSQMMDKFNADEIVRVQTEMGLTKNPEASREFLEELFSRGSAVQPAMSKIRKMEKYSETRLYYTKTRSNRPFRSFFLLTTRKLSKRELVKLAELVDMYPEPPKPAPTPDLEPASNGNEDKSPVHVGRNLGAYWNKHSGKWRLRTISGKRNYFGTADTREEATQKLEKLARKRKAKKIETPKPRKTRKTAPSMPNTIVDDMDVLLDKLASLAIKNGYSSGDTIEHPRMTLTLRESVHMRSPDGLACGLNVNDPTTTVDYTKVTCKACKNTKFYQTAKWLAEVSDTDK